MTCRDLFVRKRKLISYHNISVFGDILWGNVYKPLFSDKCWRVYQGFCTELKKGHCAGSGKSAISLAVLHFEGTFVCGITFVRQCVLNMPSILCSIDT